MNMAQRRAARAKAYARKEPVLTVSETLICWIAEMKPTAAEWKDYLAVCRKHGITPRSRT